MKSWFVKDYAHVMRIYDEPLLSGQPPLSGHSPVPRGWPLNEGCFFLDIIYLTYFWSSPPTLKTTNGLFTFFVWLIVNKRNSPNKQKRQQQQQNNNKNRITRIPFNFTLLNWTLHRPSPPPPAPSQHRHTPAPPLLTTLIAVPLDNPLISRSWCSKLTNKMSA